jgi:hypothetical protein
VSGLIKSSHPHKRRKAYDDEYIKNPYIVPDIEVVLSDKIVHVETYQGVKQEVTYISRNYATNSSVRKMAKQSSQTVIAGDGKICYLGPVIGTVEI